MELLLVLAWVYFREGKSRVGEAGVGEMGQIISETGVGENGSL